MTGRNLKVVQLGSLILALIGASMCLADPPIILTGGTVQIDNTTDMLTVPSAESDLMQPMVYRFYDGTMWMGYSFGNPDIQPDTWRSLWSLDNGDTWSIPPQYLCGVYLTQLPDGHVLQVQVLDTEYTQNHPVYARTWANPRSSTITQISSVVSTPFSVRLGYPRNLLQMPDGRILMAIFGMIAGESYDSSFLLQSTDNGITWTYVSKIAGVENGWVSGSEGYNEPALIRLKNGDVLCLLRTSGNLPLVQCRSTNGGLTWSGLTTITGAVGSVRPDIRMLSNGTLIAVSGRTGVYLLVDFTGTGNNWQKVNVYAGPSCSNSSLVEIQPNLCMLFYSKTGFTPWLPPPSDGINRIVKAVVQVTKDPPDASGVTLLSPNGGEVIYSGAGSAVRWSCQGTINNVFLEYSTDNGAHWNAMATVPNIGEYQWYQWAAPSVNSSQCLVRVSDASNASVNDVSNATFALSGMNQSINWEGRYEANVLPENDGWTAGGNTSYTTLHTGYININTIGWSGWSPDYYTRSDTNFNFTNGSSVEIRMRGYQIQHPDAAYLSLLDGNSLMESGFDIDGPQSLEPPQPGGIHLTTGYAYQDLSDWHTFRLTVLGNQVMLYIDGVEHWRTATTSADARPTAIAFGDVTSFNGNYDIDYIRWTNHGAFAPGVPVPLTLSSPNGGEKYLAGTNATISWESIGTIGNVTLEYSVNNGSLWKPISTVANTGAYSWSVPVEESTQCLVRVSDAANPSVNDVSNNVFTITSIDMRISRNWEGRYEANVLPENDGWTAGGGNSHTTLNNGYININTIGLSGWSPDYYTRSDTNFNFANGSSVETRMRGINIEHRDAAYLSLLDGSSIMESGFDINGPLSLEQPGGIYLANSGYAFLDLSDWHTFRLTVLGNQVKLYIDGVEHWRTATTSADSRPIEIAFGDVTNLNANYDIDYIRWTNQGAFAATATNAVHGTINLRNFIGAVAAIPVTIDFRNVDNATVLESYAVQLDASGNYSVGTTLTGTYDVTAKGSHWLRQKQARVSITSAGATVNFDLVNGDCDADNSVTSTDLAMVLSSLDATPVNPMADLNGDGAVNTLDLSINLSAMDTMGN